MKKILFLLLVIVVSIGSLILAIKPNSFPLQLQNTLSLVTPAQLSPVTASPLWLPVLVYHHIGTPPARMTSAEKSFFITPEWFEKHLQYLQQNNFRTVRFSDVAAYFEHGTPLPIPEGARPVIISFDDGWKNTVETALPLVQKYNMAGTLFVPTKLVGMGNGSRMTWEDIEKLRDSGWEIGSHTLWHPYLSKSLKARAEIFDSKKILEEKLGIEITTFAYPFGDSNGKIEALVKEAGYKTARSFKTGNGITHENLFNIPVVRVWGNLDLSVWKKQLFP